VPYENGQRESTLRVGTRCRICGGASSNRLWEAREMMYGTRERFTYLECGTCGCLQLLDPPGDMSRFYPNDYHPFDASVAQRDNSLERAARRLRTAVVLRKGGIARLVAGWGRRSYWLEVLRGRANTSSRILDYGCGHGALMFRLRRYGFTQVFGYDPFLGVNRVEYGNGIVVDGKLGPSVAKSFDVVISNHAFEHLAEPDAALAEIDSVLAPGGTILIRTPVAASFAWENYRTDWVQLDAPRHQFVHTPSSLEILARDNGFRILSVDYDSTAWNLYASEQYRRDIPIRDPRSYASSVPASPNRGSSLFTLTELEEFERRAQELNRAGRGDQALFVLCRPGR
jgi:SAM-dependent methyltransferase